MAGAPAVLRVAPKAAAPPAVSVRHERRSDDQPGGGQSVGSAHHQPTARRPGLAVKVMRHGEGGSDSVMGGNG